MKALLFNISNQVRKHKAKEAAYSMWKLQTPNYHPSTHQTLHGHSVLVGIDDNEAALLFDENEEIPLRTKNPDGSEMNDGYARIREWAEFRFPNLTTQQFDAIKQWILSRDTATLEQLLMPSGGTAVNLPSLPNWVTVVTLDELKSMTNFSHYFTTNDI